MVTLKLEVPKLSVVHKVVCCCPHLVSLWCALSPEELLTPMKPAKRIDGTIVGWKVEFVEARNTGTGAVTRLLMLVWERGNRREVW
jgi:hypothetical protein